MLNVVYINTTGSRSGALVSLVELARNLQADVRPILLTPSGSAARFAKNSINEVYEVPWLSQFDHTRHGRYRGTRWFIALREILLLPLTIFCVVSFSRKVADVDLIHLNEITGIIPAICLKLCLHVPLIVHVRANMGSQKKGLRSKLLWHLASRYVRTVICIDETVKSTIPSGIEAHVVHNTLDVSSLEKTSNPQSANVYRRASADTVNIGIVGTIIRVKGVFEFVEAAFQVCGLRKDVKFFVVGAGVRKLGPIRSRFYSALRLTEDAEAAIRSRIAGSEFSDRILMTGHVDDISSIYKGLDILCFPSHYDAPGRPIFEAAYFGKPSIVAIDNPLPDTLIDNVTGVAIRAKDVVSLKDAILRLVDDKDLRSRMGAAAKQLALSGFEPRANSTRVLALYKKAVSPK